MQLPSRKCSWDQMVKNSQLEVLFSRCIDVSCLLEASSNMFVNSSLNFSNPFTSASSNVDWQGKKLQYLIYSFFIAMNGNVMVIWPDKVRSHVVLNILSPNHCIIVTARCIWYQTSSTLFFLIVHILRTIFEKKKIYPVFQLGM